MPLQTFRYAACGGGNTLLGFLIYSVSYKTIFKNDVLDMGFYAIKSHNASLLVAFLINFPVGFLLMKYVVFIDSPMKGRIQLFRYFFVFICNLFLNYFILNLLVVRLHVNAIFAQVISTAIIITISYLLQRHFTFKREKIQVD
jgi:putative flippase GtrA